MSKNKFEEAGAWVGRHQAFAVIAGKCAAAQAVTLKQLKEARAFELLGLTWEKFCAERLGISRAYADDLIRRLDTLGENYLRLSEIARISPQTYRQISGHVTPEAIEVGDEKVTLTPDNAPRIRALIQNLRYALREERRRTRPNIGELQMMCENVLKHAHQLSAPTSGAIVREELARMAARYSAQWMSLSKALRREMHPTE